ncbi:hypothetical protein LZ198_11590 [Myxococcus sp. K15C18031901]|uniref:hypothetical protein n=1 Tax=Myxococcus dinghuensis TaxID=2906761 RepID=UPI0020A6F554|nr:hypothetical protein [Myxococcus dinghuensis]MCP3099512.1 hypothetical protein [Myxococcus dinghuensis]
MTEAPASPRMEPGAISIEIDGRDFHLRLGEDAEELEVEASTGEHLRLRRWGFDAHLRALDQHAKLDGAGLVFDTEGFAGDVLRDSGVPAALFEELAPVALWWASGGAMEAAVTPPPEGWIQAGKVQARLRPWTFSERARALEESMETRAEGSRVLSLERYLREMLSASLVALSPAGPLNRLDGASTAALLGQVVSLNAGEVREEDRILGGANPRSRVLADVTLKLCKALGWAPSQVWALPAAEVDRLLTMLKLTEPQAPASLPVSRPRRLSDFPDAVVIQVEGD